jgi:hypothetical protein
VPLVVALIVVLLAAGAGAAVYFLQPFHKAKAVAGTDSATRPPSSRGPSPSSGATTSPPTEQQAAQHLAALLAQSVTDHNSVVQAVGDVNNCGTGLNQDQQTFQTAATSRQSLLSQLASLPGRSSLPGQMLKALTGAWQESAKADRDYAQWAQDEASQGCIPNDHSDSAYRAAIGPDGQATSDKKTFAKLWDPIATTYSLTPYRWDQL